MVQLKLILRLLLLITVVLSISSCVNDEIDDFSLQPGDPLPSFTVQTVDGNIFSTTDNGDKTLVIIFFNTSCQDCQKELPILQQEYDKVLSNPKLQDDIEFICIAREEGTESIETYWYANGLTMPVSAQSNRDIYNMFASVGIPRIYTAKNGIITGCYGDF